MKIKEAAEIAGVSVRTLHHYDNIGLLKPETKAENGYRLYSKTDLQRLQQILFFRELDFSLADISSILNSPHFDRTDALKKQHALLQLKKKRLESIINTLEKTIAATEENKDMSAKENFEGFDMSKIDEHRKKYADEVKKRYGSTAEFRESSKRTESYTDRDWKDVTEKGNAILAEIGSLMDEGAGSEAVQMEVEKWRAHITESFYTCKIEILAGLGEMYSSDDRFKKNIDKIKTGLAAFLTEAIRIYCKENN
ncbi:MAG: MerR family transcriptional regulator [Spirochaetales bacterium]|uniref:MerR family transcriptional regulator n=1 Tax=Candidatus Thalassospirochaeta sargassi TaxID=3119039 RepID=A0AAJ1IFZ0_9SPIO|nr:MerR family transcriptional regulator [Spirochaetales bacterium]